MRDHAVESMVPRLTTDDPDVYAVAGGRPAGEALTFERGADGRVHAFPLGDNGDRFCKT